MTETSEQRSAQEKKNKLLLLICKLLISIDPLKGLDFIFKSKFSHTFTGKLFGNLWALLFSMKLL